MHSLKTPNLYIVRVYSGQQLHYPFIVRGKRSSLSGCVRFPYIASALNAQSATVVIRNQDCHIWHV